MRSFIALAGWTVFALGLVLFFPASRPFVPCARLVGTPEMRARCQPLIDAANEQVFWLQTVPMLVAVAVGYAVIVLVGLRRRRLRESRSPSSR